MAAIKKIEIQNDESLYQTKDIGAEAENVDISRDSNGEIIINTKVEIPAYTESLAVSLKNVEEKKQDEFQYTYIPEVRKVGEIIQYVGPDENGYKSGHFYKSYYNSGSDYGWNELPTADAESILNTLTASTTDIVDEDTFPTKQNSGGAWKSKTALKIFNYVKTKLGMIGDPSSRNLYLKNDGSWSNPVPGDNTYKNKILEFCYPVGSFYMSTKNVSPATFLGGTWKQHSGYILRGATSDVTFNDASNAGSGFGGEDTVTLTGNQIPAHTHGESSLVGKFQARRGGANIIAPTSDSGIFSFTQQTGDTWSNQIQFTTGSHQTDIATIDATHTHTTVGATAAHNNIPRYKNVYIWERTA